MTKQQKVQDPWAPLIEALRRHKSYTKGGISVWEEAVPLDRIDRTVPVQFREALCEQTLESVILVEAACEDGPEGRSVRGVQPGDSMVCYLPADGNHRITVRARRRWGRARAAAEAGTGWPEEYATPPILAVVIKGAPEDGCSQEPSEIQPSITRSGP
jgi:hypothetical protein